MIVQSMKLKVLIMPISLVIAVVVGIFFIKPALMSMVRAKRILTEKKQQLENLSSQNQKLQKMKSSWEAMSDEKMLVAKAVPDEDSVDSYVSEITTKASRSGVLLTNIDVEKKGGLTSAGVPCDGKSSGAILQSAAQETDALDTGNLTGAKVPPITECYEIVRLSLNTIGSWEQILDFFKYLQDMNRLSNIEEVLLSSNFQSKDKASSDLLAAKISALTFFKKKSENGNVAMASTLSNQGKFNQSALDKLKEVIYAPFDIPVVSPGGERNIFK